MKKIFFILIVTPLMLLFISVNGLFAQNNCLNFDGTDDYVEVSSSSSINFGSGDFSITLWVNSSSSNNGTIIEKIWDTWSSTGGNGWAILLLDNGRFRFSIADTPGEDPLDFNSIVGTQWNNGNWHHLAIVVDRDADVIFYINGKQDKVGDVSSESGNLSNDYPLLIGINYNKGATKDLAFNGKIEEVSLWNTVLTQAEIRTNMYREIPNPTSEANLEAYYQFNETSGTNLPDESVNSNNGTLYNMTNDDWVTSPAFAGPKNCLDFDGTDDYVEVPADPSQNITDAITIEAWVKPGSANHYQNILEKGGYYDDAYALLVKQDIQYIKFSLIGIDQHWGYGPVNLWDGKWHHIAGTYDKNGGSNNTNLYVDGYCVKSETKTGSITSDPLEKIFIGGHSYDGNLFNGPIDEVRLWNTALTAQQIRENMCKTLVGDETGLIAYYNFDNTAGTTLQDFSGNANDGTLKNMEDADWVSSSAFNTWLNTNSSTWSTTTNWSRGSAPVSSDNIGIVNYSDGTSLTLSGTPTVNNLVIGSSATPTLSSNVTVNGTLALNNDLALNGRTITLGPSATLCETSGNTLTGTSGTITTTRTFSAGDLSSGENIGGLGAEITTAANMGSTTINRGHAAQTGAGSSVGIKRYYDITPTNNTGLSATLVFRYDESELNGIDEGYLVLYKSTDGGGTWTGNGTGDTRDGTNNTVSHSSIGSFSRWTLGDSGDPLVVDLVSFTASPCMFYCFVILEWETATEIDNAGFDVWRSDARDGEYMRINHYLIPSEGGETWGADYFFIDEDVLQGRTYYYKLMDIGYNGTTTFHGIVSATVDNRGFTIANKDIVPMTENFDQQ